MAEGWLAYAVEIEGLTKTYPNGFTAVSGLTLNIPKGVFVLLGPNGAGKTTTVEILVGAIKPTSGTARILGHDILNDAIEARRRIGYLPENPAAYDEMSAARFLIYMGKLSGLSSSEASTKAEELLRWVGLEDWKSSPIGHYSAGMRQRLGVAQSLVNDPEVVFLDEPTARLDSLAKQDMVERLKQLGREGKCVFFSSQTLSEVESMADQVAVISNGKLVLQGSVEELTRRVEAAEYRIEVSEPNVLAKELEALRFATDIRVENSAVLVRSKEHEKLWRAVPGIVSLHGMELRLFMPVGTKLEETYREALEKARGTVG